MNGFRAYLHLLVSRGDMSPNEARRMMSEDDDREAAIRRLDKALVECQAARQYDAAEIMRLQAELADCRRRKDENI